jgi:alkyl sulfatase BDS1-like metallo-beta-lactamase superfamily hydrolase
MNEGKDVYTLMQETKLPPELAIGEQYGRLTWSIRGIYEGYVGWFDENPANMYAIPRSAIDADLVELAGADKIVERARDHYQAGRLVESLHLLDAVVHVQPDNAVARKLRVECYEGLRSRSVNVIETGWLRDAIRREEASIKRASAGNGS